jgi:N-methylhydantoinase B
VGNVSVEIMENVSPLFVLERELVPDSCGAGKFRGGCDQRASITVRGDKPAVVHAFFERTKNPAKGSFGGLDGGCGDFVINGQLRPPPKEKYVLNPGDKFSFCQGGGGGIFSPLERPVEMVLRDVVNEYISPESALKKYKVAINLADKTIDWQETERLRGEV